MNNFFNFIIFEIKSQNKIYQLHKFLILFFAFCIFNLSFIEMQHNITKFILNFFVVLIVITSLKLENNIFYDAFKDGSIDFIIASCSISKFIYAKFIVLTGYFMIAIIMNLLSFIMMFNIDIVYILLLFLISIIISINSISLMMLTSAINCYFHNKSGVLSLIIMPIIVPQIILSGLILNQYEEYNQSISYFVSHQNYTYLFIMIGISMIIIPFSLLFSESLMKSI